ncbi:hypothetical protein LINPERPRIM_LOCUS13646 [Linum perenne]
MEHQHASEVICFRELRSREWTIDIRHTLLEANTASDFLANEGHGLSLGAHDFCCSNSSFYNILLSDKFSISILRFIMSNDSIALPFHNNKKNSHIIFRGRLV